MDNSDNSDELDELLEEEGIEVDRDSIEDLKEKISYVEDELEDISGLHWTYTKNLLKLGLLAWIFGFSVFLWEVLLLKDSWLGFLEHKITIPLLIGTGVVPVVITIILVQRDRKRIGRLNKIRKKLLSEYHSTVLEKVDEKLV